MKSISYSYAANIFYEVENFKFYLVNNPRNNNSQNEIKLITLPFSDYSQQADKEYRYDVWFNAVFNAGQTNSNTVSILIIYKN